MTLKELAAEYRKSVEQLRNREDEIKRQIKCGELKSDMNSEMRLKYLREERYQLISTAYYLENYYTHKESDENV